MSTPNTPDEHWILIDTEAARQRYAPKLATDESLSVGIWYLTDSAKFDPGTIYRRRAPAPQPPKPARAFWATMFDRQGAAAGEIWATKEAAEQNQREDYPPIYLVECPAPPETPPEPTEAEKAWRAATVTEGGRAGVEFTSTYYAFLAGFEAARKGAAK